MEAISREATNNPSPPDSRTDTRGSPTQVGPVNKAKKEPSASYIVLEYSSSVPPASELGGEGM